MNKSPAPKSKVTLYGLATCDMTRAARKWLEAEGVAYDFHDVRADGLTRTLVGGWVKMLGWERVLNKASTTWRELPAYCSTACISNAVRAAEDERRTARRAARAAS